jgi:hypothetical protein
VRLNRTLRNSTTFCAEEILAGDRFQNAWCFRAYEVSSDAVFAVLFTKPRPSKI